MTEQPKPKAGIRFWALKKELGAETTEESKWLRTTAGRLLNRREIGSFITIDSATADKIRKQWRERPGRAARATGPTEKQIKAASTAEANARAKAEARARARAQDIASAAARIKAKARSKAEAEARAMAIAEVNARDKAKAEAEAEATIIAEAEARANAVAQAEAMAEAEAAATARIRDDSEADRKTESDPGTSARTAPGPDARPPGPAKPDELEASNLPPVRRKTTRRNWTPPDRINRDQTITAILITVISVLCSIGAVVIWKSVPAAAEWLVTIGVHRHALVTLALVYAVALIPDSNFGRRRESKFGVRASIAVPRGLAVGTLWVILATDLGDLWNRRHELAILTALVAIVGTLRPWDLTSRPLRHLLLGPMVARPGIPFSRDILRRASDIYVGPADESGTSSNAPSRLRYLRAGTTPPEWLFRALEKRLSRLARRLMSRSGSNESTWSDFENSASIELELGALQSAEDIGRTLAACTDRVAEMLTISLRATEPDETEFITNRMNPLIERLWKLGSCALPQNHLGLRLLRAARQPSSTRPTAEILRFAFEKPLQSLRQEDEIGFAVIALGYLALRLKEERLQGWAEGLIRRLEAPAGLAFPVGGPLHDLLLAIKGRSLAAQIPPLALSEEEQLDADIERIIDESRAIADTTGDHRLTDRIHPESPAHRKHRLGRIPHAIVTRAALLTVERSGIHGFAPAGFAKLGIAAALLILLPAWVLTDHSANLASDVVLITDPFRPAAEWRQKSDIADVVVDDSSGDLILGDPTGVHVFDPGTFRHWDEAIGEAGPSGAVRTLSPIEGGGVLAAVGNAVLGIDHRDPAGHWNDVIGIPDPGIGERDVLDVLRESPETLLLLTKEGVLRYHESRRVLDEIRVEPSLPGESVGWAASGGSITVLTRSAIVRLVPAGENFTATSVDMPGSLGEGLELSAVDGISFVRTTKNAMVSLDADDRWRVIVGGHQFEDSPAVIRGITANPDSDAILMMITDGDSHGLRIRPAGLRYWREGFLPDGIRHSDVDPLLAPDGANALLGDQDGGLWLVSPSETDPLALEIKRLLPEHQLTSMSVIEDGFTIVTRTKIGIQLRSGTWSMISVAGDRIETVRPLGLQGEVIAALPDPATDSRLLLVDRQGGVVEYDRRLRSMVGDRLQMLDSNGEPSQSPVSVTLDENGLVAVFPGGELRTYADPASLGTNDRAGVLVAQPTRLPDANSRPDRSIESIRDTLSGFEIIDEAGEAWEYDLATGWRDTTGIEAQIAPKTLTRLVSGMMVGLDTNGEVIFRESRSWTGSGVRITKTIPCTNGIAGITDAGLAVVVRDEIEGRPAFETILNKPDQANLELPVHDAAILPNGELWIAHSSGIAIYASQDGPAWSNADVEPEAFVRIEAVDDHLYAQTDTGDLWGISAQTGRGVLLVRECTSWTPFDDTSVLTLDVHHAMRLLEGLRSTSIILSEPGRGSGRPVAATCSRDAAWILEPESMYRVDPDGSVTVIQLPSTGATEIAANANFVMVLIGSTIHAYSTKTDEWLTNLVPGIDGLVEFPDLVMGIRQNRGLSIIGDMNEETTILPGSSPARSMARLRQNGRMLEDDRGLWMESDTGLVRWLPMGAGGVIEYDPDGELRRVGGRTFHLRPSGITELSDTDDGPRVSNIAAKNAEQVLEYEGGIAFVADESLQAPTRDFKISRRLRFGPPADDTSRIVDLAEDMTGDPVLLSREGSLLRYDSSVRRLARDAESKIRSNDARLQSIAAGDWLISDDQDGRLQLLSHDPPRVLEDVSSWAATAGRVYVIDETGKTLVGDRNDWTTLNAPRPRTTPTKLASHAPLGERSVVMLSETGSLLLRSAFAAGVRPIAPDESGFSQLRQVSEDRVLAVDGDPDEELSRLLLVDEKTGSMFLPSSILQEGPGDPLLLSERRDRMFDLAGDEVWRQDEAPLKLDVIRDLRDTGDGNRAFVIDTLGSLAELRLDRIGARPLGEFASNSTLLKLGLFKNGSPVVITDSSIERPGLPSLRRLPGTPAITMDRGVAWIDLEHRLRLDETDADSLLDRNPGDRIPIDPNSARRVQLGPFTLATDGRRTWIHDRAKEELRPLDFKPRDGMVLHIDAAEQRVLAKNDERRFHLLQLSGATPLPPVPKAASGIVPFGNLVLAPVLEQGRLIALDLDDLPDAGWRDVPLDFSLPVNTRTIHKSTLNHCVAIAEDGSAWRRSGFRNWKRIADARTFPTGNTATLQIRDVNLIDDEGLIVSEHASGVPVNAWLFNSDRLIATFRQEGDLRITLPDGTSDRIDSALLGDRPGPLATLDVTDIPEDRLLEIHVGLDSLASRSQLETETISGSGLINSLDRLVVDRDGDRVSIKVVTRLDADDPSTVQQILGFSGDSNWTPSLTASEAIEAEEGWMNLGAEDAPLLVRRSDRLLKSRAPRSIDSTEKNSILVERFDGSTKIIPFDAPPIKSPIFRQSSRNGSSIEYRRGDDWKTFRRAGAPVPEIDTPASRSNTVTHQENVGTWIIDPNGSLWFRPAGTTVRRSIEFPDAAVARSLSWERNAAGIVSLVARTDRGDYEITGAGASPWTPSTKPPVAAAFKQAGLEWRPDDARPYFDGRPVELRGNRFDHEIPLAITQDGDQIRADVMIGSTRYQRLFSTVDAELSGRLSQPITKQPSTSPAISTAAGELRLDRTSGTITIRTPRVSGGAHIERGWTPSIGPFEVDRVLRLLQIDGGWIQVTATGKILTLNPAFGDTRVVSESAEETATDIRRFGARSADVLLSSGVILRWVNTNAPPERVARSASAFADDVRDFEVPIRFADERAFEKIRIGDATTPGAARWLPDRGVFSFETLDRSSVDRVATIDGTTLLQLPTLDGQLQFDRRGRCEGTSSAGSPVFQSTVAKVENGSLSLQRRDFSSDQTGPKLLMKPFGTDADAIEVPWDLKDGLLPHLTFTAVGPFGSTRAVAFSRMAAHPFSSEGLETARNRFSKLRERPEIRLLDGFETCQGWFPDAGFEAGSDGTIKRISDRSTTRPAARKIERTQRFPRFSLERTDSPNDRSIRLMIKDRGRGVDLQLTTSGFEYDHADRYVSDPHGRVLLAEDGRTLLRIPSRSSCLDAKIIRQSSVPGRIAIEFDGSTLESAFFDFEDGGFERILADTTEPTTRGRYERSHELRLQPLDGRGLPMPRAFERGPDDSAFRTFTWRREVGGPERVLREKGGAFNHDRRRSVAKIAAGQSDAPDYAILGDDTLAWRNGETGRLIDVINRDFDSTPLVADADGEWHVRIRGRWRPLILDDAVATLGFGATGLAALDLDFATNEWAWRWGIKPELADLVSGGIRTPRGTSWLPGDRVAAFIGDGSWLYATDTGVRFSIDVPPQDEALPRFGPRPKSIRTETGTMFVTRTGDALTGFTAGEWRTIPRDDARLVANGEQLRLILREDQPAELAWRVRSESSDDGFLQLARPTSSLEGDQVLGTVEIDGRLLAITPLGLFDLQQSATPWPGPELARDARRIAPPGIAWLEIDEQEMERYLVTGDHAGYRIIEEDAITTFPFETTFDDREPIQPIFSGRRWNLIQRLDSAGQSTVLTDRDRGLEINAEGAIRSGQLRLDQVQALGTDSRGPWVRTSVAEERLDASGRLMPDRRVASGSGELFQPSLNQPSQTSFSRRISDEPGTVIRLPEFEISVNDDMLRLEDGRMVLKRESGDRIFQIASGVIIVNQYGSIRWIRNQRKWIR